MLLSYLSNTKSIYVVYCSWNDSKHCWKFDANCRSWKIIISTCRLQLETKGDSRKVITTYCTKHHAYLQSCKSTVVTGRDIALIRGVVAIIELELGCDCKRRPITRYLLSGRVSVDPCRIAECCHLVGLHLIEWPPVSCRSVFRKLHNAMASAVCS